MTQVDLPAPVLGSLSPSRAADFKTCPLLYRFRAIDRLPERPSADRVRGTVVHAVLERLFDLPAAERTVAAATALVEPAWHRLVGERPGLAGLFAGAATDTGAGAGAPDEAGAPDGAALAAWLESARDLVEAYFALEDPRRLHPAAREELVEATVQGLRLRGYVDRLDEAPGGELRVVDYKTGAIPREAYEASALFQMKFYALVLWRTRGTVPRQLRLLYLADRDMLTYSPDAAELARFERTLLALWRAVRKAAGTGDFRASPSRLCSWCDYRELCPAHGGTPPPYPGDPAERRPAEGPDPSTGPGTEADLSTGTPTTAPRLGSCRQGHSSAC